MIPVLIKKPDYGRRIFVLILIVLLLAAVCLSGKPRITHASEDQTAEQKLNENIGIQLEAIDFSELREITEKYGAEMGFYDFYREVERVLSGEFAEDGSSFFEAFLGLVSGWITSQIPLFLTVGAIAVLCGIVSDMKTKTLLSETSDAVFFVCYTLIILLLLTGVYSVYSLAESVISVSERLCDAIMPVLLTLMTALGAEVSVAVYKPASALFSGGIIGLISNIILPLFMVSVVFTVVSNLSENVRLHRLSEFFGSFSVKLMGAVFALFSAFLTVKGVTAGFSDGIGFRVAKFAARNYVPVIGGFVSDGMDLFLTGTALIKNAVGATGVVLLFIIVFVPVIKVAVFGLLLKLTASLTEPVADIRIANFLTGLSKRISVLNVAVIATGAMLLILIILVIITANTVLGV